VAWSKSEVPSCQCKAPVAEYFATQASPGALIKKRRLAGPVRPDQTEHLAGTNFESDFGESDLIAESLGQSAHTQELFGGRTHVVLAR
jgi:hypothetical protein